MRFIVTIPRLSNCSPPVRLSSSSGALLFPTLRAYAAFLDLPACLDTLLFGDADLLE
ncbi:hypothetical protein RchiOBHm_Chr6g0272441 [Rosa chinensis]|uniref:Uncharacterized protein n=1 Tax=Rosa chinensis TaxID=74649 RepID=A0A2P6PR94_ROSCH|nr:hypothetical protein RchiOBHm_Chr6g0272441 [Rosa chinensis]